MTLQQIYDKVSAHLITQNQRSMCTTIDFSVQCAYRGENGLMCAIGCLIKDKYYRQDLEGLTVNSIDVDIALKNSLGHITDLNMFRFLTALQKVHDTSLPSCWYKRLEEVAIDYGLSTYVLDQTLKQKGI